MAATYLKKKKRKNTKKINNQWEETDNEVYSCFFCVRINFKLNDMKDEIMVNILMCHNPI